MDEAHRLKNLSVFPIPMRGNEYYTVTIDHGSLVGSQSP